MKDFRAELQKAREIVKLAEKNAQLAKEAVEAERQATYKFGVEETQASLTEQFASVYQEY